MPAQGYYNNGSLNNPGTNGYYWSSSPIPGFSASACNLNLGSGHVGLYNGPRNGGFVAGSQWFK